MIDIQQSDWRVDSDVDLTTYGLGPCVGIVIGYQGRVSMLHAPMPNAGGAEAFFVELSKAIPVCDRKLVKPILAGALTTLGRPISRELANTRAWVEAELDGMGFGPPHIRWGTGVGPLAGHAMTTRISTGDVEIVLQELLDHSPADVLRLW